VTLVLLAIGLVLVVEGLALALAPSRLEEVVALIARLSRDTRRLIGLAMLALGTVLVWLARGGFG
jgi:uncharacterized protein YjeT (DUF2065 family)